MSNNIEKIYSLTPLQEGMAFQRLKDGGSTDYHVQNSFWINKEIDENKITTSLRLLAKKHEVLRTAVVLPKTTGVYKQVVLADRELEYHQYTFEGGDEKEKTKEIINNDLARPFDFEKDCLLRIYHLTVAENRHWFLFSFHHIIMDGWCTSLLLDDFMGYVEKLSDMSEEEILKQIELENEQIGSYGDFVQWLEQNNKTDGIEFWGKYLEDYDTVASINPMREASSYENTMSCINFSIGKKISDILVKAAKSMSISINSIIESAWGLTLQRYTFSNDVVFAKIISGRDIPIKGAGKILGLFINSIPCRVQSLDNMKVSEIWKNMYDKSLECMDYQYCPLSEIQKTTKLKNNLIHSVIAFENYYQTDIKSFVEKDFAREQTDYQLTLNFYQNQDGIHYNILYNPNELVQSEVIGIGLTLKKIFESMAADSEQELDKIEFVNELSLEKINKEFNQTATSKKHEESLLSYFKKHVERDENKIAVTFLEQKLTYDELDKKSDAVAAKLVATGVVPGDFVAIIAEKSLEVVIGILGIVKAGAAYVPINLEYPEKRISMILEDCNPKVILYNKSTVNSSINKICINECESAEFIAPQISNNSIAYIIYTSGTTGIPKGVMVQHSSIVNLVKECNYTSLNEDTIILQTGDISFDASTFELFGALLNGGTLCLISKEILLDIDLLKKEMKDKSINTMFITTALFNQLLSIDESFFDNLKYLMFGGEQTNEKYVKKLLDRRLDIKFSNVYGPTETTTFATHYPITEASKKTPIGKALQNVQVFVLNKEKLCGVGLPGELCIAGAGVARGYLNNPEITNKVFVDSSLCEGKLYRTGDLVRWLDDGNIEFLGRIDNQIKLNGFRIELDEINAAFTAVESISEAVTYIKQSSDGVKHIVAYVVSDEKVDTGAIKKALDSELPRYMIPAFVVQVEKMPLNENGKIDKSALPEVDMNVHKDYVKPVNKIQRELCEIIEGVLAQKKIGITDNIYELGCDSIISMKLLTKMKQLGYVLTISDLYAYPTVKEMADLLQQKSEIEEADNEEGNCIFEEMDDVISYLKSELKSYNDAVLSNRVIKKGKLTACQKRMRGKLILMSGTAIKFDNEFSINKVRECIRRVFERHEIFRYGLRRNKIIVHDYLDEYNIPYLNLKNAPDSLKDEVKAYMSGEFFSLTSEIDNKEILLHRIAAVKYSSQECYLYFPISHLIFDAMSGELLYSEIMRNYNTKNTRNTEEVSCFTDYVKQLDKGPKNLETKEIMDRLQIKEYSNSIVELGKNDTKKLKNYYLNLNLGINSDCIPKDTLWEISFKLFEKLLRYNYPVKKLPVFIICVNRKYENKSYYKTMGLFVDVMPVIITEDSNINIEYVQDMMKWMGNKNFCFTSLLLIPKILLRHIRIVIPFLKAAPYMDSVPTFNYLGMYTEMAEQTKEIDTAAYLESTDIVTRTVDFKILEDSVQILAYGSENEKDRLEEYLQNEMNTILKENGLYQDAKGGQNE